MEITIDKPTPCSATLQAAVPAADVNALREKILASYVSQAQLPGFRRGKAPKSVILKRYANSINEELTDSLTERIHQEALEKNPELKVLDFGQAETSLQEDGSFTFSSDLTIVPDFELPAYMGLEVTVPSTEVTEEEIDAALKNIAVQRAQFEPVERAAAMGDLVSIDFETSVDGKPTKEVAGDSAGFLAGREGYGAFLEKDDFLPGFAESLVGLSAGDEKDFSLDLAEDFIVSELAGKTLAFHVQAKEVRERRVPEINADLFSDILPGKSMEEIRGVVSKNLKERKEAGNNDSKADQITEQLSAHLDFELPEYLVERELQQTVRRKIHAAIQRGEKLSDDAVSSLQAESREEAKKNLRVYFVIQEIAHREHIDVTEREMLDTISRMAAQEKVTNIKSYLKKLRNGNRIQGIRLSILTSKTIELLVRNAKVTFQEDASEAGTTDAPEAGGAE
ncbi:MAG: trigger factor [Akkermansia sp.]|nr:trigger factor [Akkermansia sp.]